MVEQPTLSVGKSLSSKVTTCAVARLGEQKYAIGRSRGSERDRQCEGKERLRDEGGGGMNNMGEMLLNLRLVGMYQFWTRRATGETASSGGQRKEGIPNWGEYATPMFLIYSHFPPSCALGRR